MVPSVSAGTSTMSDVRREVPNHLTLFCTRLDWGKGPNSQSESERVCVHVAVHVCVYVSVCGYVCKAVEAVQL